MSKDKLYQQMMNSIEWRQLSRQLKVAAKWQCSECGTVTHRLAVHHIRPIETASTPMGMRTLCFDERNLQVLCFACHADIHKAARSHSKEMVRANRERRSERFMAALEETEELNVEGGLSFF